MDSSQPNVWHQVHAQREDGVAAMFLIREVEPRADQPKIFVVELPYAVTDLSGQPDAAGYRRLAAFQEQWLEPACAALAWTFVAWKSEDGSFFLYLYGAGDPELLLEHLAPFDGELGFFNDLDAEWSEYAALRELVEQAESDDDDDDGGGGGARGHVHSDACDHELNGHDDQDDEFTAGGIRVIDLTGERAAPGPRARATPSRNGASRSGAATAVHATGAKRGAASAAASKPARRAAGAGAGAKKSARQAAAPPAARRPAARRAANQRPAAPAARRAATRAANQRPAAPAARRAATKAANQRPAAPAARRAAAAPAAKRPAAKLAKKRGAARPRRAR